MNAFPSPAELPKRDEYFNEGVPIDFENARGRPCVVILEDLLNDAYSKQVCHRNIRVILITQNLFYQGLYCTDISLNAKYFVLLKSVRDKNQFTFLARQIYPKNSASLCKAYLDATQRTHGYLLLDPSKDIDDPLCLRTDILPIEHNHLLLADK